MGGSGKIGLELYVSCCDEHPVFAAPLSLDKLTGFIDKLKDTYLHNLSLYGEGEEDVFYDVARSCISGATDLIRNYEGNLSRVVIEQLNENSAKAAA